MDYYHINKVKKFSLLLKLFTYKLRDNLILNSEANIIRFSEIYSKMDELSVHLSDFVNDTYTEQEIVENFNQNQKDLDELLPYLCLYIINKRI